MTEIESKQIRDSTETELLDRIASLRERYDNPRLPAVVRGFPLPQLFELHHIEDEIRLREKQRQWRAITGVVLS